MAGKARVATEEEILATYTAIMRGRLSNYAMSRTGNEVVRIPAGVAERAKAAEVLGRHYGMFRQEKVAARKGAAEEVSRMVREMEGGAA